MESKISFNTNKVPRLNTVIPQAVISGNLIFVSGTAGVDPATGKLISSSYEEQAFQAFSNLKIILEEAGSKPGESCKNHRIYGKRTRPDFSVTNKAYSYFFPDNPPARSAPQVMPFPGGILISVECIAVL